MSGKYLVGYRNSISFDQRNSEKYKIDASRIYLTGLSMGGWGTLKLAMEHPEMFAAVVPVCAPTDQVMYANIHQYKNLNMKIFHGGMDDVVLPENAFNFIRNFIRLIHLQN
jgi:predicted peptidase